jgi:hypothetical protein
MPKTDDLQYPASGATKPAGSSASGACEQPPALVVDVVDDLAGPRPLSRRDDEVDVPSAQTVERVIRNTTRIKAHRSQLVTPGHSRLHVLKCADRLPALKARITHRDGRLPSHTAFEETRNRHSQSVRKVANRQPGQGAGLGLDLITRLRLVVDRAPARRPKEPRRGSKLPPEDHRNRTARGTRSTHRSVAALSRQYVLWQRLPVRVHCDGTVVQESRIGSISRRTPSPSVCPRPCSPWSPGSLSAPERTP